MQATFVHGMEGSNGGSAVVAPFVMKTYHMVSDPATNGLVAWGRTNNSFVVLEPLDFSQRVLPLYFRHSNFSSFVRQLNSYGFKKVDPDRWEFANEWFLCGQVQLLNNIVRRKLASKTCGVSLINHDEDEELLIEIAKLKQEQTSLERELEGMKRRLDTTERRLQQMISFLYQVAQDPQILIQFLLEKERTRALISDDGDQRIKIMASADYSSSSGKSEEDQECREITSLASGSLHIDAFCQSPTLPDMFTYHMQNMGLPLLSIKQKHQPQHHGTLSSPSMLSPSSRIEGFGAAVQLGNSITEYDNSREVGTNCFEWLAAGENATLPPPYPFSLLGV